MTNDNGKVADEVYAMVTELAMDAALGLKNNVISRKKARLQRLWHSDKFREYMAHVGVSAVMGEDRAREGGDCIGYTGMVRSAEEYSDRIFSAEPGDYNSVGFRASLSFLVNGMRDLRELGEKEKGIRLERV